MMTVPYYLLLFRRISIVVVLLSMLPTTTTKPRIAMIVNAFVTLSTVNVAVKNQNSCPSLVVQNTIMGTKTRTRTRTRTSRGGSYDSNSNSNSDDSGSGNGMIDDLSSVLPSALPGGEKQRTIPHNKFNKDNTRRRKQTRKQKEQNNNCRDSKNIKANNANSHSNNRSNNKSNKDTNSDKKKSNKRKYSDKGATMKRKLPKTIPMLSDILERRVTLYQDENYQGIPEFVQVLNLDDDGNINITSPSNDYGSTTANNNNNNSNSSSMPSSSSSSSTTASNRKTETNNKKPLPPTITASSKSSPLSGKKVKRKTALPWRAGYHASKRTQGRIKKVFMANYDQSRAQQVLDVLFKTPPEYCNAVNLVCALSYSAKAVGNNFRHHHNNDNNSNSNNSNNKSKAAVNLQNSLLKAFDTLHDLLVIHQEEKLFTPRQLCNICWAIAKHCDRDPDLLLPQTSRKNEVLDWDSLLDEASFREDKKNNLVHSDNSKLRLEESINEIARQLTIILSKESHDDDDDDDDHEDLQQKKITFQQPKIKLGEICMACWAYGKLRPREIPPGWPAPPQIGRVTAMTTSTENDDTSQSKFSFGKFTGGTISGNNYYDIDERKKSTKDASVTDKLFDAIGYSLCRSLDGDKNKEIVSLEQDGGDHPILLMDCTWSELANIGWAFASSGRCKSTESQMLLKNLAEEAAYRLKEDGTVANNNNKSNQKFLVRDVSQLMWSLGTLQADNFRLADGLVLLVESLTANLRLGKNTGPSLVQGRPLRSWSCADLVQTAVALAHARIDEQLLLQAIYKEGVHRLMEGSSSILKSTPTLVSSFEKTSSVDRPYGEDRRTFHPWEASILLWVQARLYLTEEEGAEFVEFTEDAPLFFLKTLREKRGSFIESRIGPQEQANIVWSLVILEKYHSPEAIILIDLIFQEAARSCKENQTIQLEHAHQLWQAYFILEEDCPEAIKRVPEWFISYLERKWSLEKSRNKMSSARHKSLSSTLQLMGVDHYNEHDEDIDVAIILQPNAVWSHETDMFDEVSSDSRTTEEDHVSVAVEFDGPNHFTRIRNNNSEKSPSPPDPPRALGHTVLKYRLLKKQGWTVVRIPYFEFDKIPFWASMERQRYLQRKLKTHANIEFSESDVSEYKTLTPNRKSRFD